MPVEGDPRYCVLRLVDKRVDVSEVARIVVQALHRPRFEVARQVRASHGIVAREAPEAAARRIVDELHELGIDAHILPESLVVVPPPAERVRQLGVGPNGVYFGLNDDRLAVEWSALVLVIAARLGGEIEETFRKSRDATYYAASGAEGGAARGNIADRFDWTTTKRVTRLVLDFYLRKPWRRLRAAEGAVEFTPDRDPERPGTSTQFAMVGRRIRQWGAAAYLSPGVRLLGERGTELAWNNLTFPDERHFDDYSLWQVQVALMKARERAQDVGVPRARDARHEPNDREEPV